MTARPELRGTQGAVASTHWLASAAGMAALDAGGNAFDAAATAAFVLQVVEPHLNGPAGDVPILFYDAAAGRAQVICGQGPMPTAATPAVFKGLDLDRIPGSGLLPATVPGAFGAWTRLLEEHGTLPLAQILEPAIGYAADGYPVLPKAAEAIGVLRELFADEWAESGRTYLTTGGRPPRPRSRLRNPALADTFRRLLKEASGGSRERQLRSVRRAFYEGFVAEAIDAHCRTAYLDATGAPHAGLLTGADLASWRPQLEETATRTYRGLEVHKPGPWSQGPVFLQQLALLEGYDLAAMGLDSADHLHTVVECAKLAYADREAWYGDPDFGDVPLDVLLSDEYAGGRRELVSPERASDRLRPGSPGGREPCVPPLDVADVPEGPYWRGQLYDGLPTVVAAAVAETQARGDTCCLTVADRYGNMVAATPSGGWLKSSPVVPGLGFPLGTRGQMAWLHEGHPNSLAPGKRPRTTLSPTLVVEGGRARLAFGTPGGDQQDQWTLGFFLAHVDFGLDLQQAVETLAFHSEHVPSSFVPRTHQPLGVRIESRRSPSVAAELERRGHVLVDVPDWSLGKVCAVGAEVGEGLLLAAASPRGEQAYAVAR